MVALSAGVFLLYACDMPESPASPSVPPPYKLTQDKGGTNLTLKIDEGVTIIKAGEYAAVPSIGSGADKKTLNTKITTQALGLKTDGEVHTAVTTIILPSTLETIEDYAFYGHTAVKGTLIIPDKVQSIGAHAFGKTGTALTLDIKDDSKLGTIGAGAFDIASIAKIQAPRCTLTKNADNSTYTLAVAEDVTTVARGEFSSQESTAGSTAITLNTRFKGALLGAKPQDAITAITLPSTLETIEDYAFYGHSAVKGTLIIPDKVKSVGASAFGKTGTALTIDLKDDSKLGTIGAGAFDIASIARIQAPRYTLTKNADNTTYTLAVAEGVTTAAKGEFSALDNVPESTPKITLNTRLKGVFLGTEPESAITAITLPSTLETIEDHAFRNNQKVQGTLTIPKAVQSIGENAFVSDFSFVSSRELTLTFEDESQLRTIGDSAFYNTGIRQLGPLPERLEVIGERAFLNNGIITTSLIIPRNVTRIGDGAFARLYTRITGTLTIESPHLTRTPNDTAQEKTGALGDNLFVYLFDGGIEASNFSTIKLHQAVYDSYTQAELTQIFGTGTRGKYQDLDGNTLPVKP